VYHVVEHGLMDGLFDESSVVVDFGDDGIVEIPLSERGDRLSRSKTSGCQEYLEIRGLPWLETRELDTLLGLFGLLSPLKLKTRLNRSLIGILFLCFVTQFPSMLDIKTSRSGELLIILSEILLNLFRLFIRILIRLTKLSYGSIKL
jgi:hypothetical protein